MVAILESLAAQIGTTIDNKWEALLYLIGYGRAQQYACQLSEYAQDVFNVVCTVT
jgi:hypothetical protein